MGTNYYVDVPRGEACHECGMHGGTERLHVGKSNSGWKFCFNSQSGRFPTFAVWEQFLNTNSDALFDEYGRKQEVKDFLEFVKSKQDGITMFTMPDHIRGPYDHNPEMYEYIDPEGYRFSKIDDFS